MAENAKCLDKSKTKGQLIRDLQSLRQNTADSDRLLNDILAMYKEVPIGLCVFDHNLRFRHINSWLAEINGVSAEEHLGHSIFEILPDVAQGVEQQLLQVLETGVPITGGTVEAETPAHPGIKMVYQHNYYPLKSDNTTIVGVSCVVENVTDRIRAEQELHKVLNGLEDRIAKRTHQLNNTNTLLLKEISERKKTENLLKRNEKKFRTVLESAYDGIIMLKADGKFELVNEKLLQMSGYMRDELIGQPVEILIPEKSSDQVQARKKHFNKIESRKIDTGMDLHLLCKDGKILPVDISLSSIEVDGEVTTIAVIRDISERKKSVELLVHQANHDALTGLINRREFERRAEHLLSSCKHNKDKHVLCFMDLDQFKLVNDTCNHAAGDEMLRQISSLLANMIRNRDTLARLGGDEFGLLMEHCSLQNAYRVSKALQVAIQDYQFIWNKHKFKIGVSIGIVAITKDTRTIAETIKQADEACYLSKEQGRNCINIYQSGDAELVRHQIETQLIECLYQSIEENLFFLYAQPILSLDGNADEHHEVLLRMQDEKGNIISPRDFLPVAERYSLMVKIDLWVIENIFNLLSSNILFQTHNDFCSVNLSGQSLTDLEILRLITKKLSETGIPGNKICFEITETTAIKNLNAAVKFISTLKNLGCRFALDDFGSGLSSFAYLKILPVDFIKIDGIFIKNIATDSIDYSMVKSINEISHLMDKETVAKGVENEDTLEKLTEIGVDYIQGYIVGNPSPIGATTWIDNKGT